MARMEMPSTPSRPTKWPSRMISVAGTSVFISRMVPAVARIGPPVRMLTCVPVAKISSAISGSALFLNSAVVKPPMASASGANVPSSDPRISGSSMRPPGTFIMVV
ncbi:hypothetical protein OkiPb01555_05840 [Bordetella pertussis]|nr:hypothetical protein BPJ_22180 [Bordetella pertussis]BDT08217.1 hypothetical protein BP3J_19210 [Bordetella pertussis]